MALFSLVAMLLWFQSDSGTGAPGDSTSMVAAIVSSGRCVSLGESPDQRVGTGLWVTPGEPPLLSFRLYEGRLHHRDLNTDLMLDDAGH